MEENLNIPPEAIRTMKKDLMGITQNEWDLSLAKAEIDALLRALEENNLNTKEIPIKSEPKKEEKIIPAPEPKKIEQIKKSEPKKEEKIIKIEIKKQPSASDKEQEIVKEIKARAKEREEMVRREFDSSKDKESLNDEIAYEKQSETKKEQELLKKLEELKAELKNLPAEKAPTEESQNYYKQQLAKIMKDLEPVLESERKIEENIKFIEGIEKTSITPRQKKKAEQERQLAEQERELIEKQRWDYEQKKFQVEKQLKEIDFGFRQIAQKEARIKQDIERINRDLEKIDRAKEKEEIELKIKAIIKERQLYSKSKESILEKRKDVEERLAEAMTQEQKIERELSYIQAEERLATDTEKQKIEKRRWGLEKTRSELEKNRWDIEEEKRKIRLEENRVNVHYDKILEKENELRKRIQDINRLLGLVVPSEPELPPNPVGVTEEVPQEQEAVNKGLEPVETGRPKVETQRKENIKKGIGPVKKSIPTDGSPESQELDPKKIKAKAELEKLEAKRRKEELLKKLRMQREQDVKEKEDILMRRIRQDNPDQPQNVEPASPSSHASTPMMSVDGDSFNQGKWKKIILISGLAVIFLAIALFIYWNTNIRGNDEPNPLPQVETPAPEPEPIEIPDPQSYLPGALVNSTIPLEFDDINTLGSLVSSMYQLDELEQGKFTRLLFKFPDRPLIADEILSSLGLDLPGTIDSDSTWFIYPGKDNNNLGFISPSYEEESLDDSETLLSFYDGIITLGGILEIENLKDVEVINEDIIKTQNYKEYELTYLDLENDTGCYGSCMTKTKDNGLIFATCCSPITKYIDYLEETND